VEICKQQTRQNGSFNHCKNVAPEIHSKSTSTTSPVKKRPKQAENFSQYGALKMYHQPKGDTNQFNFSQFEWLNSSR